MADEGTRSVQDDEEVIVDCKDEHVADLDEPTRRFLSTFATIRSKVDDLARAESDFKRFELSIEQERKRLLKTLEASKTALKNARVQMAAELAKLDAVGFSQIADLVKSREVTGA